MKRTMDLNEIRKIIAVENANKYVKSVEALNLRLTV
jgi:hypothetical protein